MTVAQQGEKKNAIIERSLGSDVREPLRRWRAGYISVQSGLLHVQGPLRAIKNAVD